MQKIIGLSKDYAEKIAVKLNELLADYEVFYQNLRGFHWNVVGRDFFQLHLKYEEMYDAAFASIDEVAERILTLGQRPLHTFTGFLASSSIREVSDVSGGIETAQQVVQNLSLMLEKEREVLALASESNDEGTAAMVSDFIKRNEKDAWMLSAFLR